MAAHGSLTASLDLLRARGHRYDIEIHEPGRQPRRVAVGDVVEIGRGRAPGLLRVAHGAVSRRHARLQVLGGLLIVTDLGSMNGTFVNDRRINASTRIGPGDVVRITEVRIVVLGPATPAPKPVGTPFPNYLRLRRRVPANAWFGAQVLAVAAVLTLVGLLIAVPPVGLHLLWQFVVPILPLVWVLAPGGWRNSCPLAATNQLARLARFSLALEPPAWLRRHGFTIAVGLFVAVIAGRRPLFDHSGPASAALLVTALVAAFTGGVLLKGKSGWCSSICPLLPIQRLYGQTPFVTVANSHCRPCVGCAKHCYDFNPAAAYQADLHDADPQWTAPRKLFAGCMPGVVLGYFLAFEPFPAWFAAAVLTSAGSFFALEALLHVRASLLAAGYGAVALSLFYWYAGPVLAATLHAPALAWLLRLGVPVLAGWWMWRTLRVRRRFVQHAVHAPGIATAAPLVAPLDADGVEVTFQPHGHRVLAEPGASLLELAERDGLPIEAGCRMGVCGADPVQIVSGAGNLAPAGDDETATLRRLGLGAQARLACCARVHGPVTATLDPTRPPVVAAPRRARHTRLGRLVIVGNGIAGVTVAQEVRNTDRECEIHLVGREPHPLYNRMGIGRMVYGRSAMTGLFLQPDDWYEQRGITSWLNTRAIGLSVVDRTVALGTGEELRYDRLVLATGARATTPAVPGVRLPGCFVLRDADDAIRIRAYAQEHNAGRAVVVGAGPLAVEGAYALHQLGLAVSIIVRGSHLLRRHLDARAADLLAGYLRGRGIALVPHAEVRAIAGTDRVRTVELADGRRVSTDLVLVCAGADPDIALAREAGLATRRGILVDPGLRTAAPDIFAAGDVAEVDGVVAGLWPSAVRQATAVAANLLGEAHTAAPASAPMLVKDIGVDLASAGRLTALPGERVLIRQERASYGRLVLAGDRLVGAVLLGLPKEAARLLPAVGSVVSTPGWQDAG